MTKIRERLPTIREDYIRSHNWRKENRIQDCTTWGGYMSDHRMFAVCAYVLDHDVAGFFEHMKECVEYSLKELQHMTTNESPVNMDYGYYQDILYALTAGDLDASIKATQLNEKVNLKKPKPPAVPLYFHKAFRLLILGQVDFLHDLEEMEEVFAKKEKSFLGYAQCFKAIYKNDVDGFYQGFDLMMKGHKRLCHPYGMFGNSADEVLAIWPLAVVNLARFKGLDVSINHPLVPQELVTKQLGGL